MSRQERIVRQEGPATVSEEAWTPTVREGEKPEDVPLGRWVGEAIGAASSCWENLRGAGVFDSTRAKGIVDSLGVRIEQALEEAEARGYQRGQQDMQRVRQELIRQRGQGNHATLANIQAIAWPDEERP